MCGSASCSAVARKLPRNRLWELLRPHGFKRRVRRGSSCLKINLHVLTGEHPQAIDGALACLRLFGIDLPAHPTLEQVRAEYATVQQTLGGHSIESLIDLPLMTDPTMQATLQVLSALAGPATFTDFQLFCLLACRMVSVSIQHGMSGAAAYAYACLGSVLGANFHRYREGYRLARLACDLVEKHAFTAYDTKVNHALGLAAFLDGAAYERDRTASGDHSPRH